jgi:hypothetical protein
VWRTEVVLGTVGWKNGRHGRMRDESDYERNLSRFSYASKMEENAGVSEERIMGTDWRKRRNISSSVLTCEKMRPMPMLAAQWYYWMTGA